MRSRNFRIHASLGQKVCHQLLSTARNFRLTALPTPALAQTTQVVEYYHTDALSSVRAVTNQQGQVIRRHDFRPFGEELQATVPPPDKPLFTGKERDAETGLDYFGARYQRAGVGRFTSVDPGQASASVDDPQGWNAYAYARNNPLRYTDPDGREYQICAYGGTCGTVSDQYFSQIARSPGAGITLREGWIFATVNGQQVVAGTYEQTSVDPTFNSLIRQTGDLSSRWLKENLREMAIGSALSAVGGAVSGALSGGLAVGGTAAASDVTDLAVVTAKGARYANYATKLTAREFQSNLLANGYKIVRQGISTNGPFTVLSSGEKTYTIYTATTTGGASVQVRVAGQIISKIRLGGF